VTISSSPARKTPALSTPSSAYLELRLIEEAYRSGPGATFQRRARRCSGSRSAVAAGLRPERASVGVEPVADREDGAVAGRLAGSRRVVRRDRPGVGRPALERPRAGQGVGDASALRPRQPGRDDRVRRRRRPRDDERPAPTR
jgi:hypothetical protein